MLKSMTGFGRCEMATDEYKISVEMKAVNHRYLDLSIKMPKKFNYFEAAIRAQLKKYITPAGSPLHAPDAAPSPGTPAPRLWLRSLPEGFRVHFPGLHQSGLPPG